MRKVIFDRYLGESISLKIIDFGKEENISLKFSCSKPKMKFEYNECEAEEDKERLLQKQYMILSSYIGKNSLKMVNNHDAMIEGETIVIKGTVFDQIMYDLGFDKNTIYDLTKFMKLQGIMIPDPHGYSKRVKFIDKKIQRCAVIRLDYDYNK